MMRGFCDGLLGGLQDLDIGGSLPLRSRYF